MASLKNEQRTCGSCGATILGAWWEDAAGGYRCRVCGTLNPGPPPPGSPLRANRALAWVVVGIGLLWAGVYSFGMLMAPWWSTSEAGVRLVMLLVPAAVVVLSLAWLVRTGSSLLGAAVVALVLVGIQAMPVISILNRMGLSDDPCSITGMGVLDLPSWEARAGPHLTENPGSYSPLTYFGAEVGDEETGVDVAFGVDLEHPSIPIYGATARIFGVDDPLTADEQGVLGAWFDVMAQCQPDAVTWLEEAMRRGAAVAPGESYWDERAFGPVKANFNFYDVYSVKGLRIEFGRW